MGKYISYSLLAITLCLGILSAKAQYNNQRIGVSHSYPLNYAGWENAFLSGNGKMGIMVFGNPLHETIIYNDYRFNLAKSKDRSFAQVDPEIIGRIKTLCAEGSFREADLLAVSSAQYSNGGDGNWHPGYEMLIDLRKNGPIRGYSRICNFRTGEIIVKWTDNLGSWERRSFVSRADNVTVQYLTAPTKGKISCSISLATDQEMAFPEGMIFTNVSGGDFLNMRVKYSNNNGAGYEGVTRIWVKGGRKKITGHILEITGASSVLLLTRTDRYSASCEAQWNRQDLQRLLNHIPPSYQVLLSRHVAIHRQIYDRVKIDLGASAPDRLKSNEELLAMQKQSDVPVRALWERIFDAGRYYFLSSSSALTPPALLGIWGGDCNAGWGGFYHLDANLNLQIGGGNIGDMPEAMEGYFKINEDWRTDFETNAKKLLGCRGLLAAGNAPNGDSNSGLMANINNYYPYQYATGEEGWLLYPFWEHYLVTGDVTFLKKRLYPLLREMGDFYEDFLKKTDASGHFIFAGSVSPENQPANIPVSLLNNSLFDISGAEFCLSTLIKTCSILKLEQGAGNGIERWSAMLKRFPPRLVNEDGALQEWAWPGLKDHYDHRHSSQLLDVWPYRKIEAGHNDTALFNAARVTLKKKDAFDYSNAGHGLLHSALIATVLNEPRAVNSKLLRLTSGDWYYNSLATSHNAGHNIFCTDVCNTVPTIMMDMLIASSADDIELLPALPPDIRTGAISGVKCLNQVTVEELKWDLNKHIIKCRLRSNIDQLINIILPMDHVSKNIKLKKDVPETLLVTI